MTAYIAVGTGPMRAARRERITGFKRGEASRKAMQAANGIPALSRPTRIGIVEQEQKGVSAPKKPPRTVEVPSPRPARVRLIRSSGM